MPYLLVANPAAGSGADELAARATAALNDVRTIQLTRGSDLAREIAGAIDEGRTIIACGGDGTVNATAQHVAGTQGILGILPGGTVNHFARDLGVRHPDTAISTLAEGRRVTVDVGRAGDRVFVNNVGFGMYPEIVREREHREVSEGRWPALLASAVRVMMDFDPLEGTIAADGKVRPLAATEVFVGNNRFSTSPASVGRRERLDEGVLDLRVMRTHAGVLGRAREGWRTAAARPRRIVSFAARRVDVSLRQPRLMAMDGEQEAERADISLRSDPAALRVLAPAAGRN
jgi:diacylglycerol kinase family enzyme